MRGTLVVTGDPAADELLNTDPFALLVGMLLDQQVPMEWAFVAPYRLKERLGGELDVGKIAAMDPGEFEAIFRQKPGAAPVSRGRWASGSTPCPSTSSTPTAATRPRIWDEAGSGEELYRRLRALPGYGDEKAKIFVAVLAKRVGVAPPGWEEYAGPFADDTPRSVADIDSAEALARVREFKKAKRAEGKGKQD